MTNITLEHRRDSESGFTLIELLVVILIIGILASIALPAFLGQRLKAQDAEAKSNARNLVSYIEGCWQNEESYIGCTAEIADAETGMSIGTGPNQVRVVSEDRNSYVIEAVSKADTGGVNHRFRIEHLEGVVTRTCAPASTGGCKADNTW